MPRAFPALAAALLLSAVRGSSPAWSEASPLEGGAPSSEKRRLAGLLERRKSELRELVLLARARGLPLTAAGALAEGEALPEEAHEGAEAALDRALEGAGAAHEATHEHEHLGGHHHEGEGEGEGEEEEEIEFSPWDNDTSVMLLGMILSVMMLFYLTNWPDDDIRLYTWQITSSTISIFCSVMLFSGFDSLLCHLFERDDNPLTMVGLHFLHCFLYLAIMHVGTAVESGVMCDTAEKEATLPEYKWVWVDGLQCTNGELVPEDMLCNIRGNSTGQFDGAGSKKGVLELKEVWMQDVMEIPVEKKQHEFLKRKRRTKALAMLTAHMAGFAAIASGVSLQKYSNNYLAEELDIDEQWSLTVQKALLCVSLMLNQLVLRMAFKVSEIFRDIEHWRHYIRIKSEGSGSTTEAKHGFQMKEELMVDENTEGEHDVSSLSMSYLAVNIMRFCLTGHLNDMQAKEPTQFRPDLYWHVLPLYAFGLLAVVAACCQSIAMVKFKWPDPQANATIFHTLNSILNATAMCFAWCMLVATEWAIEWLSREKGLDLHPVLKAVLIAWVLNAIVCGALFAMDRAHDRMKEQRTGKEMVFVNQIVRINVTALGILVGFSWEHCFDGSVDTISEKVSTEQRLIIEILMGIGVCIVILPAWRRYILQRVMQIEDRMLEEEESQDAVADTSPPESRDNVESTPLLCAPAGRQGDGGSPDTFLLPSPRSQAWGATGQSTAETGASPSGPAAGPRRGSLKGSANKIRHSDPRELTPAAPSGS